MRRIFYVLLLASIFLEACTITDKRESTRVIEDMNASLLDSLIPIWQKELNVPNVGLGLFADGEVILEKVYGNSQMGEAAPSNMLFNVASVTKVVFTATALKLVEEGSLKLDEPVYNDFVDPDLQGDERHKLLTPFHLLSQQSGFSNNWRWDHPTEKLTFSADPGSTYNYSGEGMEYLQRTIEKRQRADLHQLADSILFQPLGMTSTMHTWDGIRNQSLFSGAFDTKGKSYEVEDHSVFASAADDLITTAGDMTRFGIYILEKVRTAQQPYLQMVEKHAAINPNLNQGLGWRMVNDLSNGEYAIQHGGNDMGVAAIIVLLPESNRGLVIMTNADNGTLVCNKIIRTALPNIGPEIVHKSYKSGPSLEKKELSEESILEFLGTYEQASGREMKFEILKGNLHLEMAGIPNLDFYNLEGDSFFSPDFDFTLNFHRNKQDLVNACSLFFEDRNEIRAEKVN